jgi:membrane-associated protease RseP (regulator of RpoE activity)
MSGGVASAEKQHGARPNERSRWWAGWKERRAEARRRRRMRGVVRRIDPWSVFRVSLVFYVAMYCILVVAGVLLWSAATATGFRANVEDFIASLAESGEFRFVADELFRASVICGAILTVMGTGANVLFAVLYNLISDVVGGVVVVVEEKPSRKALESVGEELPEEPAEGAAAPEGEPEPVPEKPSVPAAAAAAASVMPGVVGPATPATTPAAATPAAIVGDFGLGLGPAGTGPPTTPDG